MAEDAAMETCPSPEMGDSRKRPLDSDPENEQTKRSHFSSGKFCKSKSKSKIETIKKKQKQKKAQTMYIIMSISVSLLHISHIIVLSIPPLHPKKKKEKTIYLPTYLSICHIFYLSIYRSSIYRSKLYYVVPFCFFLFLFTFFCYSVAVAPPLHCSVACKYLEIVTHTHTHIHAKHTQTCICTAVAIVLLLSEI